MAIEAGKIKCKVCGRVVKITKQETVALHGYTQRGPTNSEGCPGSGFNHTRTSAEIADRLEEKAKLMPEHLPSHAKYYFQLAEKVRKEAAQCN